MSRKVYYEKLLFVLIAIIYAFILSTRYIPDISSKNDTGRYVENITNYPNKYDNGNYKLNEKIYYSIVTSFFDRETIRLYFYITSIAISLVIILVIKWSQLDFFIALAVIFSVYFVDLSTNALRECLALSLFLVTINSSNKMVKLISFLFAISIHYFILLYLPFLLLYYAYSNKKLYKYIIFAWLLILLILSFFYFRMHNVIIFFRTIYAKGNSVLFNIFMILPIVIIFLFTLHYKNRKDKSNSTALFFGLYLIILLLLSIIFIPYITYRLTLSGYIILMCMLLGSGYSFKMKLVFPLISMSHLLAYIILSSNIHGLWL